jgi:PEP-CTERM putative exosortase interaction domain
MAGFGRNRVQAATTNASVSDAITLTNGTGYTTTSPQVQRWGTNRTVAPSFIAPTATITVAGRTSTVTATQFDTPTNNTWLTTSEAQAVLGDSGGGLFTTNGILAGIVAAVSANGLEAEFGEKTFFTDIASYKTAVDNAIGYPLVPEPATSALIAFGAASALFFALRRRS